MLQKFDRGTLAFLGTVVLAAIGAYLFLSHYFQIYYRPDAALPVYALEGGWEYRTDRAPRAALGQPGAVRPGEVGAGETLTLFRPLNTAVEGASLMLHTRHQTLRVLLDGALLYESAPVEAGEDPGVRLHLIELPAGYVGKELALEVSSPYRAFSGRVDEVLLGPVSALEAAMFSSALRPVLFMAICLFLGFCTIGMAFAQGLQGERRWEYLAIGLFAVNWGVYYLCNESVALHFFTPLQASMFSLGCYYFMQVPLSLFFCCSFRHCRRAMIPATCAHSAFVGAAFLLHAAGRVRLPALVDWNNAVILAGLLYTAALCALEVRRGNRSLWAAAPFLLLAWISTAVDCGYFYLTRQPTRFVHLDFYFLLIVAVLAYNLWEFFRQYYRERRESELLLLRSELAVESYELEREHNQRLRELKHEFNKHMGALQLYLGYGKFDEARQYLQHMTGEYADLKLAAYCDNLLVNALVGRMLRSARQSGVEVELEIGEIGEIEMDDGDLFSMLGNILDNALEACEAVPEGRDRTIRLSVRRREPYLHIVCENSCRGEAVREEEGFRSTKPNPEEHGFGLRNVRRIVDSYDGMMDIAVTDITFEIALAVKVASPAAIQAETGRR